MLKRYLISLVLFFVLLFFLAGCAELSQTHKPSDSQSAQKDNDLKDEALSANYYYLESRFHIKANALDKAVVSLEKAIERDPGSFILNRDLIQIYLLQKNKDKALAQAEKLIKKNPEDVDSLLLFVLLIKDDIDEQKLITILQKILKIDPENKETFLRLGKIYMDKNDKQKALALFQKMVEKFPEYYVAWYYLGELYLFEKQFKLAEPAFLKTIELEPELVEPRFQLIKIYEALNTKNKYSKIETTLKQVLELEPDNHRALLGMALNDYKSGRKQKAQKLFMTLGQDIDKDPKLMMTAFDEYITGSNKEDAVIVFSQMLKTNPKNSTLNFFTAIAYENIKELNKAISFYQNVSSDHPQYKKAGLGIALIYKKMGKNKIAINFLEDRLKASPKDIDMIIYLASFYEKDKQEDKGIALLKKGAQYSPENTTLLFRLGALQDKAGFHEDSLATMASILQIDPDDASALNYIGYSYADKGVQLPYALSLLKKAHSIKPDDGYITDSLGWVYYKMGDYENAILYLEKAARISSYETIIADHLADAYAKNNQLKKAIDTYKKAIANAKDDDEKKQIVDIQKKITTIQNRLNE